MLEDLGLEDLESVDQAAMESPALPADDEPIDAAEMVASSDETELEWLTDELPSDDTDLDAEDTLLDASPSNIEADAWELEAISEVSDGAEVESEKAAKPDQPAAVEDDEAIFAFEKIDDQSEKSTPTAGEDRSQESADAALDYESAAGSMRTAPIVPKQRSRLAAIGKLVVGALLACVIAQALAWYGLGVDPLGLALLVPALAPQSLRPATTASWTPPVRGASGSDSLPGFDDSDDDSEAGDDAAVSDDALSADDSMVDDFPPVASSGTTPNQEPDEMAVDPLADSAADSGSVDPNGDFFVEDLAEDDAVVEESTASSPPEEFGEMLEASKPTGTDLGAADDELAGDEADAFASDGFDALEMDADADADAEMTDLDELLGDNAAAADDSEWEGTAGALADEPGDVAMPADADSGGRLFDDNRPIGAASFTRNDVAATISSTRKAQQAFEEARLLESPDIKQIAIDFYVSFCNLAERATLVGESGSEAVRAEARKIMKEYASDESRQRFIANCARGWLQPKPAASVVPERGPGVFLTGRVNLIQAIGPIYEMQVRLNESRQTEVVVVTRLNPSANPISSITQGSNVLMMGTKVDDPISNLPGYTGNAASVIYVTDQMSLAP